MGSLEKVDSSNLLFSPIKLGNVELKHRIVLAPLTRVRATPNGHVPMDFVAEYYAQRASEPGTFLVTEATYVAHKAAGMAGTPGIWNDEQIEAWKKVRDGDYRSAFFRLRRLQVTEAVHAKGSFIYCQIWGLGRSADPANLAENGFDYVAASDVPFSTSKDNVPRPMTIDEIKEYPTLFAQAAENAITAGFDGVEIHG